MSSLHDHQLTVIKQNKSLCT